jgi:ribose-phosphate pyrophosphokinase
VKDAEATTIVLPLPGNERLARTLADTLGGSTGSPTVRRFPDGESYVRIEEPVREREVVLACTLVRPDDKVLSLLFLAATARDLGARSVGLVAPYLAYMRQDRRFQEGEGVTSTYFAALLSGAFDWLVTVDPHLHRRSSLSDIYSVPNVVVHAAAEVSAWIRSNVTRPVLVGPDSESAQWVAAVGLEAGAPVVVLEKVRHGDREVSVEVPDVERWRGYTPVLVDDIISTAQTMAETVGNLRRAGLSDPVCVGVHAVFAEGAYERLRAAGVQRVVTTDTIVHASNAIEMGARLAHGVRSVRERTE